MNDEVKSYGAGYRIKAFFKQKMALIILSVGCLVFIFKDAINWQLSNLDLSVLITSMIVTYLFTLYVIIIMGKMGLKSGKDTEVFKSTLKYYSDAKTACEPIRNYLGQYCKLKTEEEKYIAQKTILDEENLDINKLDTYEEKSLTKRQWKLVQKARKVKVIRLQERDLVSERGWQKNNQYGTYLGKSEVEFVKKSDITNAISKIIIPIVLSYISIESIVLTNVLAGCIKVVVILFSGLINYLSNEDFATNELRNRFINKADFLIDFKAMYDKGVFEEKKEPLSIEELEQEFLPN